MRRASMISTLTAGLLACGGGGETAAGTSSGTGGSGGSGSGGGGASGIVCDGAPADPALEGIWAATGKLAVTLQGAPGGAITICPADQIGEANLLLVISVETDPGDASKLTAVSPILCSIELPTVSALVGNCDPAADNLVYTQLVTPKPFVDALPKVKAMPVSGAVTGKGNGAPVKLDRFSVTMGSTKMGDMLPHWDTDAAACAGASVGHTNACEMACVSDCAALTDDDGDTFPGVTLQVCGVTEDDQMAGVPCHADDPDMPGATLQGKASVDLQVDPAFTGNAKSSCEVVGTVDSQVLYNVVGADVYLAGAPVTVNQAIKSLPAFEVDAAKSKFRMVRIDGKYGAPSFGVDPKDPVAACAELAKRVNEL